VRRTIRFRPLSAGRDGPVLLLQATVALSASSPSRSSRQRPRPCMAASSGLSMGFLRGAPRHRVRKPVCRPGVTWGTREAARPGVLPTTVQLAHPGRARRPPPQTSATAALRGPLRRSLGSPPHRAPIRSKARSKAGFRPRRARQRRQGLGRPAAGASGAGSAGARRRARRPRRALPGSGRRSASSIAGRGAARDAQPGRPTTPCVGGEPRATASSAKVPSGRLTHRRGGTEAP